MNEKVSQLSGSRHSLFVIDGAFTYERGSLGEVVMEEDRARGWG